MSAAEYITLSQLQAAIRDSLAAAFPAPVWLIAEIADLKVNYSSGHCYLEFVEKGTANGVPKAQARGVIWRQAYGMLSSYFKAAAGQDLAVGMKVLVSARVTYHELYGMSLQITDIDPMYTLGDMERQRRQTIEQLVEDGVFDLNRELPVADVSQRIAVVSSPGAAGLQDFMRELDSSPYRFEVVLFEAIMQGHGAEEAIIGALERIAAEVDNFDMAAIIRGGGSQSDLNFLNSYLLASNVAQFPLPVLTGLGHDKDRSVVDMVAAVPLKTPTAAAAYLIRQAAEVDADLESLEEQLENIVRQTFSEHEQIVSNAADGLSRESTELYRNMEQKLARAALELSRGSAALARNVEQRLARFEGDVSASTGHMVSACWGRLSLMKMLLDERAGNMLSSAQIRLAGLERAVSGHDPAKILSMGFAIVRSAGRAIMHPSQANPGDTLEITLAKGKIAAKVEK